jgi:glucose/mannose transport system permease protein
MAMYLAGLRGIPEELREAALVDGCNEWQVYRHIILPMLQPITLSAIIMLGHISLKIFDLVYIMAGGENLQVDVPGVNMYLTAFRGNNFSLGAAMAFVMLIMVAVIIVPYLIYQFRTEASAQ